MLAGLFSPGLVALCSSLHKVHPLRNQFRENIHQNTQSSPSLLFCALQNLGPISECTKFVQFDFLLLLCDQNNITQVNNIFWVMVLRGPSPMLYGLLPSVAA